MKLGFMMKTWDLAQKFASGLLVANIALAMTAAMTAYIAMGNRERVVLVPPHLDEKVELTMNSATAEYQKSFGLYLANLLGNVTPDNLEFTARVLSRHLSPEVYTQVRRQLKLAGNDPSFRNSGAASWFRATRLDYEAATRRVFVLGTLNTVAAGKSQPAQTKVVYEMRVEIQDGLPIVTQFDSYEDDVPHTTAWAQRESAKEREELRKEGVVTDAPNAPLIEEPVKK